MLKTKGGTMEIIKEKAVCFTGHRPEKIMRVAGIDEPAVEMIKSMLYYQIYRAAEEGYEFFISGLARGVDMWAAEYVIDLKKKYPRMKLICAKPFENHQKSFHGKDLWELMNVLRHADEVVTVSREYSKNCYRLRNYYMVDNSSRLIAVVENFRSGTGQTINYARKKGIDIKMINISDYALKENCENDKNSGIIRFT